jgi:hypothetical protein
MKRPSKPMLITIVLVTAVVAIVIWAAVWMDAACHTPRHRDALAIGKAGGCFEFWLNRYQGLFGNLITAAVAAATLIWVARGFDLSERQANADAIAHLRDRIRRLDEEQAAARGVMRHLMDMNALRSMFLQARRSRENFLETAAMYREAIEGIDAITKGTRANSALHRDSPLVSIRVEFIKLAHDAADLGKANASQLVRSSMGLLSEGLFERLSATADEIQQRVKKADQLRTDLIKGLDAEIAQTLEEIQAHDRGAILPTAGIASDRPLTRTASRAYLSYGAGERFHFCCIHASRWFGCKGAQEHAVRQGAGHKATSAGRGWARLTADCGVRTTPQCPAKRLRKRKKSVGQARPLVEAPASI